VNGLLDDIFPTSAQKQPQPHAPLDAQNRAAIAERAVRQAGLQAAHGPQIAVVGVAGQSPLKKMHAQVVVALALGMPQDRRFDGLNFRRFDSINLILADQLVADCEAMFGPTMHRLRSGSVTQRLRQQTARSARYGSSDFPFQRASSPRPDLRQGGSRDRRPANSSVRRVR